LLLVTHDGALAEGCTTRTWEIENGTILVR
jgi:hypothetical protein